MIVSRSSLAPGLLAITLASTIGAAVAAPEPKPAARGAGIRQLERSWARLDQDIRLLDQLLPPTPPGAGSPGTPAGLGPALLRANAPARGPLDLDAPDLSPPALALPTGASLSQGSVQSISLSQALALSYAQSPELQEQRLAVAQALADLQARLGRYWPQIEALAGLGYEQSGTGFSVPSGNPRLGFGGPFAPGGAFYVPTGATAYLNQGYRSLGAGLELRYILLDFARTPAVQAARAQLREARSRYANGLRRLQLTVSEAYYNLQRSDQLVRIRQADLSNDLAILQDVLALKQAGLVPRLDLLRRRAIEADSEELLTQAFADRAVARRRLATLLNLSPAMTPSASDPVSLRPAWPLDLESSLLAAYQGNPELEAVLATREALARNRDAVAAQLLPKLSFVGQAGASGDQTSQWSITGDCCGIAVIPILNSGGYDWAVGLTFRWLLFDAGSTAAEVRSLARREEAQAQRYAAQRNDIRLRLEQAFFEHEASLAKLASTRRGVAASLEGFRDARLRYQSGLSDETTLSLTQDRLVQSLVRRLNATIDVNITYARLLRELLPVPRDPAKPLQPQLELPRSVGSALLRAPAAAAPPRASIDPPPAPGTGATP